MKTIKIKLLAYLNLILLISILLSCSNNTKTSDTVNEDEAKGNKKEEGKTKKVSEIKVIISESKEELKKYYEIPFIKEFYTYTAPPDLSFPEDLSALTYEDLWLLRNEVYARNGYLFNNGFLRGYFNRFKWYMPVFDIDTFKVILNKEEQNLINSILKEEKKRKKNLYISQKGLQLLNTDLIVNNKQFVKVPSKVKEDLSAQNFSIIAANRAMPFYVYDNNAYQHIPHYITTDLYLFILHKYFSSFLEKLDESFMSNSFLKLFESISDKAEILKEKHTEGQLFSALEWAQMYTATALYAAGDSRIKPPSSFNSVFQSEMQCIDNEGGGPSFIGNKFVKYTELKPRGHYTKNKKLQNYFKGFKWVSLNGIDLGNDEQLRGMIVMAYIIKNDNNLKKIYEKYVNTIEKLAGQEDNLSCVDIIAALPDVEIKEVISEKVLNKVRSSLSSLNKERVKRTFGESFFPEERNKKRVSFLSSTYSISGEIFSTLIHIDYTKSKRPFPNGLDIPAVFGNKTAQNILLNEFKVSLKWSEYLPKLKKLQSQFQKFNNWDHNYGFKGVQVALSASAEKDNYPDFMKSDSYNRKELSTSLASWTHIKHDLILYQEKPFAAEAGQGGGPEPPQHFSYVEPNIEFWNKALELTEWLKELSKLESRYNDELKRIIEIGKMLKNAAGKHLNGEELTEEEYYRLHYIGGSIEHILLGLLETDHLPARESSMGLIADVYIYNGINLNVAVGNADDIYVVVPINGEYYVARGAVFSYYEFKEDKIYNDEEWRSKIKNNKDFKRPKWISPIINNINPLGGQMQFRYAGSDM